MFRYSLTPNTELRLVEPRHTEAIYEAVERNRQHLQRWLPWVDAVVDQRDIAMPRRNLIELADHGHFATGIWQQGQVIGMIGIHAIDWRNRQTSLGYWLAEQAQGQGLMTQACRVLLDHLFGVLGLHRVEIRAAAGNLRSQAVARRLGFRHEGTLRQGQWMTEGPVDQVVFAMLRDDWQDSGERLAFSCPLMDDAELRLPLPHYAEEIFAVADRNRAHLRPWMSWMDSTTQVEHSRGFIRHALHALAEGRELHCGIWHRGQFAGGIGTLPIDHANKKVEIGYWLAEDAQGQGLMTRAGKVLIDYLFTTLDLHRIEIRFRATNARSQAVAERLGFTREGVQRQAYWQDGQTSDIVCTALLREEWQG